MKRFLTMGFFLTWMVVSFRTEQEVANFLSSLPAQQAVEAKVTVKRYQYGIPIWVIFYSK